MKKMSSVTKCVTAAVCMALCVVLPMAVHSIPNGGTLLSPMHLPVLLCGLICGWPYGLACGIIGPLLSSLISGMPPAGPILYGMLVELAVYGLVTGLLMQFVHTGKWMADFYISLIAAMLAGRIAGGMGNCILYIQSPRNHPPVAPAARTFHSTAEGTSDSQPIRHPLKTYTRHTKTGTSVTTEVPVTFLM